MIIFLIILALAVLTSVSTVVLIVCAGVAGIFLMPASGQKKGE